MRFEFDTLFDEPELPERPAYVHDSKIGIIHSSVEAVVSKVPRGGMYFTDFYTYAIFGRRCTCNIYKLLLW